MTALKPALVRAYGMDSWGWIPAVADLTAPTVAEMTALTGFDMSCSLFREQEGLTGTPEKVTLPGLLCETESFEATGSTTYSMADVSVSFNPQGADGSDGVKAWETMDDLATGVLWRRMGVTSGATPTADEYVDLIPGQLGVKVPGKTGTGAEAVYNFIVPISVIARPRFRVQIAA